MHQECGACSVHTYALFMRSCVAPCCFVLFFYQSKNSLLARQEWSYSRMFSSEAQCEVNPQ